ncbi:MAG: sugar transferase [Bacteroidota bacterium]
MYDLIKRFFDIIFSLLALMVLSPLFIVIILVLKFTGEGEVFYKQQRVGFRNQRFGIWKFATMVKDSAKIGAGDVTLRNDPRVTSFGKFLRISKINELPQMINILTGDMSFVGPRPLMPEGFYRYSPHLQDVVYNVVPGLTGIGSIVFRDEEMIVSSSALSPHDCYTQIIMPYKGELEIWYQKNMGFFTDLGLLLLTIWYVVSPDSKLVYKFFSDLPKRKPQLV